MHYSYLCYKNCFVEIKQNSKHFPNLMAQCSAILSLSIYLSVYLSIYLSIYLYISLCTFAEPVSNVFSICLKLSFHRGVTYLKILIMSIFGAGSRGPIKNSTAKKFCAKVLFIQDHHF